MYDQLVVTQVQENSLRQDLTFVEKAQFAVRLIDAVGSGAAVMAALGLDKAAVP